MMATVLTAQGETPIAPRNHNAPAEPFDLFSESIEDLLLEANNFLDGSEIETEEQENAVASILTRLRREANGADDARKDEKRPHDEAAKAVQTKWTPLLERADMAVKAAKAALAKYLIKKDTELRAAAEAARLEAEELAAAARSTTVAPDDLAGQTTLKVRQEAAADAARRATRLGKATAQARGGERAVGLRTAYRAEVTDALAFAKWAWANRNPDYLEFLTGLAERECRHGPKGIPGVEVHEERKAV